MEVFFYGLFMDRDILLKNGVNPVNPRTACLNGYALKIGNRASLLPSEGAKSWGVVMTVEEQAMKALYAEASVADYIPESVVVVTEDGQRIEAICYNLPAHLMTGTNEAYARSLYELACKLKFPGEYLDEILKMAGAPKH